MTLGAAAGLLLLFAAGAPLSQKLLRGRPRRRRFCTLLCVLAALACVLLMLALLVALLALYRRQPDRYVPLLRAWFIIVGICGVLFLIPQMVSSALEVFFTISAALLVRKAWLYRR